MYPHSWSILMPPSLQYCGVGNSSSEKELSSLDWLPWNGFWNLSWNTVKKVNNQKSHQKTQGQKPSTDSLIKDKVKRLYNQLVFIISDPSPSKCWLFWEPEPKYQGVIASPWTFPHQSWVENSPVCSWSPGAILNYGLWNLLLHYICKGH